MNILPFKMKNYTGIYGSLSTFYWMGFCAVMAFASLYLLEVGVSNTGIGILIALGGIASGFLQPVVAGYADQKGPVSIKILTAICGFLLVVCGGALLFTANSMVCSLVLYWFAVMLIQVMQPLVNALGMATVNSGKVMNLGVARAMGSSGYAILAYGMGILAAKMGAYMIPIGILCSFGAVTLLVLVYPVERGNVCEKASGAVRQSATGLAFINRYQNFMVTIAGLSLIYMGHALINTFTLQIMESKGGGSAEMGIATFVSATVELIIMLLFVKAEKMVGLKRLIQISGLAFTVKIVASLFCTSAIQFYGVQTLQFFGWGIMAVGIIYYVNQIMEPMDVVKGQAYATLAYTMGSVLSSFMGGFLIDWFGIGVMLTVGAVLSGIGSVIIWITVEKENCFR